MKRENYKKIIALFCFVSIFLTFFGCVKDKPVATPTDVIAETSLQSLSVSEKTDNAPVFMLEELPEIGGYVDDIIFNKNYSGTRETFTPGENYGKLVPFVGAFRDYHIVDYETEEWTDIIYHVFKYGLMTDKGEIVVDAVYDYFHINEHKNGEYTIELSQEGETFETAGKKLICASDGSWVKSGDTFSRSEFSVADDDMLVCVDNSAVDWENNTGSPKTIFYNTNGEKLFEFENCNIADFSGFSDGYFVLSFFTDYFNYECENKFIDKNGNIVFEDVSPDENFKDGKTIAKDHFGKSGIFTSEGKWLVKPIFDSIFMTGNYYCCKINSTTIILDKNGEEFLTVSDYELGDKTIDAFGDRLFFTLSDYSQSEVMFSYFYAETGEPIICKETGVKVTDYLHQTEYFYYDDGTHTYIVNFDGNTVAKLDGVAETINRISDKGFEFVEGHWEDETQKYTVYSDKFEKLWSDTIRNKGDIVYIYNNDDFVIKAYSSQSERGFFDDYTSYDIVDIKTGKPIFEGVSDYRTADINGEIYYFINDGTYSCSYSPELKLLTRIRNENND